ncbi:MAG: isoprenylcysteine carboxylmethyltransferase family protein [Chloroflexi bacterium]|nr:MAG: isoprenylcysteine carboxylmethyltransferase family protein [Chloroflexota bacterium]
MCFLLAGKENDMETEQFFRWIFVLVLAASLTVSASFRRRARVTGGTIARTEEGRGMLFLRLLFALPLWFSFLGYGLNPNWLSWSQVALPVWLRWVGVGLGLVCVPMLWWVFVSIGSNISETVLTKESHELVTYGPYRWVRHPLYGVALLLLAGCSLMAANWFMGLMTVLSGGMIVWFVIPREEAALIARFGEEYKRYRERVGMLFPKIG